jgi:hypothetical protein
MIQDFPQKHKDDIFKTFINEKLNLHPLPWKTEDDWGTNILDASGKEVFHCLGSDTAKEVIKLANEYGPLYKQEAADFEKEIGLNTLET